MKKRLTLAVSACLAVAISCSSDPLEIRDSTLKSGDALMAQGKVAEAVIEYRKAVQADGTSAEARVKLGDAFLQQNDVRLAAEQLVRAADLKPDDVTLHLKAGRALLAVGAFSDAQARAEKILAADPTNMDGHILKGNALGGLRDFERAIAEIQTAIQFNPAEAAGYGHLGAVLTAKGDARAAEEAFKRAIVADPKSVNLHLALANLYWSTARTREAETAIQTALQVDPGNLLANQFLAALLLGSRRTAEAEAPLKMVAERTGKPEDRIVLADYYAQARRMADAEAIYREVSSGATRHASTARLRLAALGLTRGDREGAYREIEAVLSKEPAHVEALSGRAHLQLQDGKLAEALASARMAVAAGPQSPAAHYMHGLVLLGHYQTEEARTAFETALQASPAFAPASVELARLALSERRFDDAVRHAQAAIDRVPRYPAAHLLLVRAHLASGNAAGAEPSLRVMERNVPDSPELAAELGRLRLLKGDRAGARSAFESVLTKDPANATAVEGLIRLDLADKRRTQARSRLDAAVAKARPDGEIHLVAARLYAVDFDDRAAAEASVKRALEANPNDLQAFDTLARVYAAANNLPAATVEFERLAERRPKSVGHHTAVGVLHQLQGNLDKSRAAYERALAIDARAGVAANNLAGLYADRNENLDVALELARTAKAALPRSHEVDDTLGWLYYKKGRGPEAVKTLKAAVSGQPDNAIYLYHFGAAQALVLDRAGARQSLERALKLQSNFPGADDARKILDSLKN